MADTTDNVFLASIKALDKVVLPAVDPADPLAGEQLRLVSGFLKFLRSRVPHLGQRLRFELGHGLALARDVLPEARLVSDEVARRLDAAIDQATAAQAQASASEAQLRAATAALNAPVSVLVRLVGSGAVDAGLCRRVERKVVEGSKPWVDMQRTWFLPQGFELRPGDLPGLDEALAQPAVAPQPAR
jgi:hypothetical protein